MDDSQVEEREGTEQIGRITTLKENTRELKIILDAVDKLSEDVYRKLEARKLSFKSVSFNRYTPQLAAAGIRHSSYMFP